MKQQERAIIIQVDGVTLRVSFESYIKATTRMIQEFGYPNLTQDEVREQAEKILAGDDSLTVIGVLMQSNIASDQSQA